MKRALAISTSLIVLACAARAHAYRPFDSTDADVAHAGEFELELGPVGYLRARPQSLLTLPAVILNVGVVHRLEAVLEGKHLFLLEGVPGEPRNRVVDGGAFLKLVLREGCLQDARGPSVALEAGAKLPTWNDQRGSGAAATVIGSQQWDDTTLHLNVGIARERDGAIASVTGLIWEGPRRWRVRPVSEVVHERNSDGNYVVSVLNGAIVPVGESFAFDAALRLARSNEVNALEVRAGFTWAVQLWGK